MCEGQLLRLNLFLFEPSLGKASPKALSPPSHSPSLSCEMVAAISCLSTADVGVGLCPARDSVYRRESRPGGFSTPPGDGSTRHMCCWTRETLSGSTQALFLSMQMWTKHDEPSSLWPWPQHFHVDHLPVTQIYSHSPQEPVVDDVLVNGI